MTLCRRCWVVFFAAFTVFTLSAAFCRSGHAEVTAIEIGAHNRQLLPKGKEADGIQGDFVLRNEHIEALIGGNLPLRRANMTTHSLYDGTGSITPGCLYDLSVRGSNNDQLTLLAPGNLRGPVSTIAIRKDGSDGQALLFVHRTAARGDGREVSHLYLLEKGWRHLLILSLYENKGEHDWELSPKPFVKGLRSPTIAQGITFADAMNPTDHQGYAWAPTDYPDATDSLDDTVLKPGEKRSFALVVAPGHSPAEAYGVVAQQRGGVSTANVRLRSGGVGVPTGKLLVRLPGDIDLPGYPNDAGDLQLLLPPGTYGYAAIDIGRPRVSGSFQLSSDNTTSVDVSMESASKIRLAIRDADDHFSGPFPCKAQFIGIAGTPNPYFGVDIQAHGCRNQYHSERGDFTVA
ncbi:MAG: hypothetical protein MK538_18615, partial [Planctomycetes bacterium]|nr:hypothetical protein [Planctomycetota bacterium]